MPTLQVYGIKVSLQDNFSGALEKTTGKTESKLKAFTKNRYIQRLKELNLKATHNGRQLGGYQSVRSTFRTGHKVHH